jgi:hypothetical protein
MTLHEGNNSDLWSLDGIMKFESLAAHNKTEVQCTGIRNQGAP